MIVHLLWPIYLELLKVLVRGKGLGLRFLRHIERNSTLLFLVPADADDIAAEYSILLKELETYNPELLDKDYSSLNF